MWIIDIVDLRAIFTLYMASRDVVQIHIDIQNLKIYNIYARRAGHRFS